MSDTTEQVVIAVPAKKSKVMLVAVLALSVCAAISVAAFLMHKKNAHAEKPAEPEVKSVLHLDTFVVNIGSPEQNGYLRVGIDLGCAGEAKGGEAKESSTPTALVRDTILAVLTATKPDELMTAEGKSKLKESIAQALRARAPELKVHEVYYTEFLLQR